MALSEERLRQLLVQGGVVADTDFDRLNQEAQATNVPLPRYLISQGKLTPQYLNELISHFLDIPIIILKTFPLTTEVIQNIPEAVARQRQVLVFDKDAARNTYKVAMVDPTDIENINYLRAYLKGEVAPYITTSEDLRFAYQFYKKKSSENFELILSGKIKELDKHLKKSQGNILESVPLTELFDTLLDYAAILDTSDVYFQPEETLLKVRFRVDGLLRDVLTLDLTLNDGLVARVKTLSQLRIDEHLKPQDGRFRFRSNDIDIDIRVAVMPTIFGEKVTLRLLTSNQAFLSFEELGVDSTIDTKLERAIKNPYGMILSSGPTGSGKTTTIYGVLSRLNKPEVNITTIEDPIEYIMPNVSQTQVNLQAGITFATGLRALLRHNPDIIFIGEIRDKETADVSVNAALTGHLLISTIHTNDAPSTIIRLIDLGIEPFLISSTLNAVLAQRLVRKICLNCIESHAPTPAIVERFAEELKKNGNAAPPPKLVYSGKGCPTCNFSGYKGRTGLFELLLIDEGLRNIINSAHLTTDTIRKAAHEQGMLTILEDGLAKAERGVTTLEEVLRVTSE